MTPLGYIMLAVAMASFLFSPKWLYRMLVFWSLFSASTAANIGSGTDVSALQIWMLFGTAWLARLVLDNLMRLSFALDRRILQQCLWLLGFILVAAISLWMPVYINGSLMIMSPALMKISETPLYLTSHNVTQLLYLIFGGCITLAVAHGNLNETTRRHTERVLLVSAVVLAAWGLMQFFCNVTGLIYPAFLLNNSKAISGQGYMETLQGMGRISSATTEPSVFAEAMLSMLPLTLPAWLGRKPILGPVIDRGCTILLVTVLLLSTSSTGYLGMGVLGVTWIAILLKSRTMKAGKSLGRILIIGVALIGVLAVIIAAVPAAQDIARRAVFEKGASGSALERAMTVVLALGYFMQYPILGVGWGSVTSHDVIALMLSNVGIVGFAVFLGTVGTVLLRSWRTLVPLSDSLSTSRAVWLTAIAVYQLITFVAGFPLAYGNYWVVLGLAIATGWRPQSEVNSPQTSTIPEPAFS